eukprot:snap_masked-scaffold_72-processed-gene-0.39-mRNA-1 protein AED:0.02 eAED:0.02 QI:0/0/0/1/1/1/2/0/560
MKNETKDLNLRFFLLLAIFFVLVLYKLRNDSQQVFKELKGLREEDFERDRELDGDSSAKLNDHKAYSPLPKKLGFIRIISTLQALEKKRLFPPDYTPRIAILGKSFVLKRDLTLWMDTFEKMNFFPFKTTKLELQTEKHKNWDIMLCLDLFDGKTHCIEPSELSKLEHRQKVNRIVGLRKILWNKDRFCESMNQFQELSGHSEESMNYVFPCWILPKDSKRFFIEAKSKYKNSSFIVKPTDRGEGNGIFVIDNYLQLSAMGKSFQDFDQALVQEYLSRPFLINGRKWDMRTYILVTSLNPLRLYLYNDGLVRFASTKYDKRARNGGRRTSFLTNTSVNKKSGVDVDELTWNFEQLRAYMKQKIGQKKFALLWQSISNAITKVFLSAEIPFVRAFKKAGASSWTYDCKHCYQLIGVDIIVDEDLVPRVIEVNGEPSMQLSQNIDSQYDNTKKHMAHDVIQLLFNQQKLAYPLAKILMQLHFSYQIDYATENTLNNLSEKDMEHILAMFSESEGRGGFERIYPANTSTFDEVVFKLSTHMPYGITSETEKLHMLTKLLSYIF